MTAPLEPRRRAAPGHALRRSRDEERPRVSVVIPTFNRVDGLCRVLRGYEAQQPAGLPFEVVVVDDGSDDGTSAVLSDWRSRRFTLRFDRQPNQGPARARNRASEMVSGDLVLFGGDDIEPDPNQVVEHVREHDRRGDVRTAILGLTRWPEGITLTSTMRHIDGPGAQQFSYGVFEDGAEYDFRHFYTSNVSVRRHMLARDPAGFSTDFTAAAFEDAEFAYRLSRRGMRIIYHRAAVAWHHHPYDARSFFSRQERCGEMADVLFRKHPQLAKWIDLKGLGWGRIELLGADRQHRRVASRVAADLSMWERRAVDLAVFLDLPVSEIADTLLHPLFRYAYLKGLAVARFGPRNGARLAADLWLRLLPPAVDILCRQSRARGIPLPNSDIAAILSLVHPLRVGPNHRV